MSDIKTMALEKAILFLNASGAEYVVVFGGKTYQSAKPVDAEAAGDRLKRVRSNNGLIRDFKNTTGYLKTLAELQPGQTSKFCRKDYEVLKDDDAWASFMASVISASRGRFGVQGYIAHRDHQECTIEILRV